MKHLIHTLLIIASAWGLRASAQTPYDSFAPETSRPMLGVAEHEVKASAISMVLNRWRSNRKIEKATETTWRKV